MPPVHEPDSDLVVEGPGVTPIAVVPWTVLWRQRVQARVAGSDRRSWIVLAIVLSGLFAVGFTITVLAVSLEALADDLSADTATITWVITGPMLAMAVVGPTWGKLADIYGARRMYLAGMSAAAVLAGCTALAWSGASLVAFRVLAAAAGAAAGPASMALINTSFDRARRVQAMGYWALVAAGGPVVGVVAGAPVVEAFGWKWIFLAQAPLIATVVVIGFVALPETPRRADVRFDVPGSVLLAVAAASFLVGLNQGPKLGWTAPLVLTAFVATPVLGAAWLVVERLVPEPLFPLEYLGRRNVALPLANQYFTNAAYMGGFLLTPALLQQVLGQSLAQSGYVSIIRPLTFAAAGPVAGWMAMRVGERVSSLAGSVMILASMLTFATVGVASGLAPVMVALALSGVGMGAASPAMAATVANAVADHDLGVVGAAQQMVALMGTVTGTQVLFTVQQAREATSLAGSYQSAYLVGAALCAGGVLAAAFVRRTVHDAPGGGVPPGTGAAREEADLGARVTADALS